MSEGPQLDPMLLKDHMQEIRPIYKNFTKISELGTRQPGQKRPILEYGQNWLILDQIFNFQTRIRPTRT